MWVLLIINMYAKYTGEINTRLFDKMILINIIYMYAKIIDKKYF